MRATPRATPPAAPRATPPAAPRATPRHTTAPKRIRQPPTKTADLIAIDQARLALTIDEAAYQLAIGRHLMYQLVMAGEIESFKIGRFRRIAVGALEAYVRQQQACASE